MSVSLDGAIIRLDGPCRVEDAEPLLMLLRADPRRAIDLTGAGPLHTSVVQVLLALQPPIRGEPSDPFVTMWLMPLMSQGHAARQLHEGSALNLVVPNPPGTNLC